MKLTRIAGLIGAAVILAACEEELILEGERFLPREPFDATIAEEAAQRAAQRTEPVSLPESRRNAAWTHRNGSAAHRITHPALDTTLRRAWSADIGAGDGRRHRITAAPVVADGRVFTLDSRAHVTATGTDGQQLWQRDLTPSYAGPDDASGGGLATADGTLYVTSGFGRLVALDARTGEDRWVQRFDAPVTGAPTVAGDTVHVVATDGSGWAINTQNGRVRWQVQGAPGPATMTGGTSPALTDRMVLLPSPSGGVTGVLRDGARLWATSVGGKREGRAYAGVPGLLGIPVVVGDTLYLGNHSGRLVALDISDGERRWTVDEGLTGPVWPVGGQLFFLTDEGRLARIDAATGERIWHVGLPHYRDARERRRAEVVAHHGPVLAGGRLLVASNDGYLRSFAPESGAMTDVTELPAGATTSPVVVNGTLYIVTTDGQLHAFR